MDKVLVIDDEESIRFSFKTHLMNEAYEVMTAEDYSSGMEAVIHFNPDLVIRDITRLNNLEEGLKA
jgi:two-component system, NtrC family, response regulator HydG